MGTIDKYLLVTERNNQSSPEEKLIYLETYNQSYSKEYIKLKVNTPSI